MNKQQIKKVSKFMSLVLRHQPKEIGLSLDENGWGEVKDLLQGMANKGFKVTKSDLEIIVKDNDKQHFTLSENQVYSVFADLELEPVKPPETLYHETVARFLGSIYIQGLSKNNVWLTDHVSPKYINHDGLGE